MFSSRHPTHGRRRRLLSCRAVFLCLATLVLVGYLLSPTGILEVDMGPLNPRLSIIAEPDPAEDPIQPERDPDPPKFEGQNSVELRVPEIFQDQPTTTPRAELTTTPRRIKKPKPKPRRLCSSAIGTKNAKGVSHDVGDFEFGYPWVVTPGWDGPEVMEWTGDQNITVLGFDLEEECEPANPPELVGALSLDEFINVDLEMEEINALHPNVQSGGAWTPQLPEAVEMDAAACPKVAIIIPYRDRWQHLKIVLNFLHTLLPRQQISYRVFVAEQFGNSTFSRGVVSNAAFTTLMAPLTGFGFSDSTFDCIVFQDVDLLPEDDRNLYNCAKSPQHFAVNMDKFDYKMPYDRYFGGVLAFTPTHFLQINGYPNSYWGWGGEDDDLFFRTEAAGLTVSRLSDDVARYKMLTHSDEKRLPNQFTCDLLRTARTRYPLDGLSTLHFRLLRVDEEPLYTRLLLDVGLPDRVHYPDS